MKKTVILSVLIVAAVVIGLVYNFSIKPNSEKEVKQPDTSSVETNEGENQGNGNAEIDNPQSGNAEGTNPESGNQETEQEGYEILVSQKELTVGKGKEASFDITFTTPDPMLIREYITCKDQDDIITVKYTPLKDRKITVEVEALKAGSTEISICDFEYPNRVVIVNVNVVEEN